MDAHDKLAHGTREWFGMVGEVMLDAAARAGLAPDLHVSLVERYIDGAPLGAGLVQGLRFAIRGGQAAFRIGAGLDERGDITLEVTAAGARQLNTLSGADPCFRASVAALRDSGHLHIDGDLAQLGDWFGAVHDEIVRRTR